MRTLLTAALLLAAATATARTTVLEAQVTYGTTTYDIMEQVGWGEGQMILNFPEGWMHFNEWSPGGATAGISFSFGSHTLPSHGHVVIDTLWDYAEVKRNMEPPGGNFLFDGVPIPPTYYAYWHPYDITPGVHRIDFSESAGRRGAMTIVFDPVPEPASWMLLAGCVVLTVAAKRNPLILRSSNERAGAV